VVDYTRNGTAWSDFGIREQAQALAEGGGSVSTCTGNLIHAVRLLIAEGKVDANDIELRFNGSHVICNRYGAIVECPCGFADTDVRICEDILKAAMCKRSKEREANGYVRVFGLGQTGYQRGRL
jgi:hypothetical protein